MSRVKEPSILHSKLAKIRAELNGGIKKTGTNPHFKYKFVEASVVGQQLVTLFSENGLTMLPVEVEEAEVSETISGKEWLHTISMKWRITDSESGEFIDVVSMGQGADPGDKGVPKALTNNLKYAILLVLQAAGDDPEADGAVDESTGEKPRAARSGPRGSTRGGRGRGTAVAKPDDDEGDGAVSRSKSMASTDFKKRIRALAREVGLNDDDLKKFAFLHTGQTTSTEWTERDAEKIQSRLGRPDIVEQFKEDVVTSADKGTTEETSNH